MQIPYNQLLTTPQQYQRGFPPIQLPWTLPQELIPYGNIIASTIATDASQRASDTFGRAYYFNCISMNGWNTRLFLEAVELAGWMIYFALVDRRATSHEQVLDQACIEANSGLVARMILEVPELRAAVDQNIAHQATLNVHQLTTIISRINGARHQLAQSTPPQAQQHYPSPHASGAVTIGIGTNQPAPQLNDRYSERLQSDISITTAPAPAPAQAIAAPASAAPVATPKHTQPVIVERKPRNGYLTLDEVMIVDREEHTLYFGGNEFPVNTGTRVFRATQDANALADAVQVKTDSPLVSKVTKLALNLEDAILQARVSNNQLKATRPNNMVYRTPAIIATPFVTGTDYRPVLSEILTAKNFSAMAQAMRIAGREQIQTKEPNDRLSILVIIEFINKIVTRRLRQYLHFELGRFNMSFDDFMLDIGDLMKWVSSQEDKTFVKNFRQIEAELVSSFCKLTDEYEHELIDTTTPDAGVFNYVSYFSTITLVDLFEKELGFKLQNDAFHLINPTTNSLLYSVCMGLYDPDYASSDPTMWNFLVTLDGMVYTLHSSLANPGKYAIRQFQPY